MSTEISERDVDQAASELRPIHGGPREDYFGLLYLERQHKLSRDQALNQIAFGGNDYGVDGFHFDEVRRNLYIYQFKFSPHAARFVDSLQRLIEDGLHRIFVSPTQDASKNQVLLKLRNCLRENRSIVDQVYVRFVFTGEIIEVERSEAIQRLREDLEDRRHHLSSFFGDRHVEFLVDFMSTKPGEVGETHVPPPPPVFPISFDDPILLEGPAGQEMHVGFIPLVSLCHMSEELGNEFLHRNIRYGLGRDGSVNRAIEATFKAIAIENTEDPRAFAFNHNGITLYAEKVEDALGSDGATHAVTAPRLLNGAQTVTAARDFLKRQADHPKLANGGSKAFNAIRVLCRIVTSPDLAFVARVTVNNNRQNPVATWNLRANDLIQLELQDKFRTELGIYYERQENAFEQHDPDTLEDAGIREHAKAIELLKLTQTFAVTDGQVNRLSEMRAIFEEDRLYNQVFRPERLRADARQILICYKVQTKLAGLARAIEEKGRSRYWYASRARHLIWALICQGLLNDPDIEELAEEHGNSLVVRAEFTDHLNSLARTRVSILLHELLSDSEYKAKVDEDNLSFLRTANAFVKCMKTAHGKWRWVHKKLA